MGKIRFEWNDKPKFKFYRKKIRFECNEKIDLKYIEKTRFEFYEKN